MNTAAVETLKTQCDYVECSEGPMAQPHGTPETHYQISEDSGRDRDGDGYTAHQSLDVLINCEDLTVNAKYCSMLVMIYDMFVMWRCHCTILLLVSSTQFVVEQEILDHSQTLLGKCLITCAPVGNELRGYISMDS